MIDLSKTRLHLENGPRASPIPEAATRREHAGRVLGITRADAPDGLHPALWERHPHGDEVLYLVEGRVRIVVETGEGEERVELGKGETFIVPQGAWHRFERLGPCELLFVTPGTGSEFKPYEA